jgi:hypothetical protein
MPAWAGGDAKGREAVSVVLGGCAANETVTASGSGQFTLNATLSTNLFWCILAAEGRSSHRSAEATFTMEG